MLTIFTTSYFLEFKDFHPCSIFCVNGTGTFLKLNSNSNGLMFSACRQQNTVQSNDLTYDDIQSTLKMYLQMSTRPRMSRVIGYVMLIYHLVCGIIVPLRSLHLIFTVYINDKVNTYIFCVKMLACFYRCFKHNPFSFKSPICCL